MHAKYLSENVKGKNFQIYKKIQIIKFVGVKFVSNDPGVVRTEVFNNWRNSNIFFKILFKIITPIAYLFTKNCE